MLEMGQAAATFQRFIEQMLVLLVHSCRSLETLVLQGS